MADVTAGFPFLKLPLELRNMVYKEILVMPGQIYVAPSKRQSSKIPSRVVDFTSDKSGGLVIATNMSQPLVLRVFLVSKQMRQEAISIYFGSNKFNATETDKLAEFLRRIGPDACNAIRELSIWYRSGKYASKAFKLLAQCGSLRKIHFKIFDHDWISAAASPSGFVPLLDKPGIQSLLKVRGIQELELEVNYGPIRGQILMQMHEGNKDKEKFMQALQILKEPRDLQKQRRLPPKELRSKVSMMTRARASRKE